MRWGLDYAAQQSSGYIIWRRDIDHIEKGFVFAGMPARNGVTAGVVVRSGWGGVDDVFSGPDNFFHAYAPKAKPEQIANKLGERYEIALTDIKKWSVGSPIQAPLDGIIAIRGKRPRRSGAARDGARRRLYENVDLTPAATCCCSHCGGRQDHDEALIAATYITERTRRTIAVACCSA